MTSVLTQIKRWLMRPKVWRHVGFVSTVIGLLCYALSSSFNHIFGEWNLLKIFLYSVFSLILCLIILVANGWDHSPSLLSKAHMVVLVLTVTSIYTFFFDKATQGKPDAYSIISCANFAVMSLSLSRQTHFGFEVDLLYFFLGFLIVLLMKLNVLVGIFGGGGFSYVILIPRSWLDAPPLGNGFVRRLQNDVVINVNSLQTNSGRANQADSPQAGAALIVPQQADTDSVPIMTSDAPPENGYPELQDRGVTRVDSHWQQANTDSTVIMQRLMFLIELLKEDGYFNRYVIDTLWNHVGKYFIADVDSSIYKDQILVTDHNLVIDALPPGIIEHLRTTMSDMVDHGFEKECCHVYSSWRKEFLQDCQWRLFRLPDLGIEDDVDNMKRIQRWINASNITLKILFPNERTLCDRVLGLSFAADLSFMEVCWDLTIRLLNFHDFFAVGSLSPTLLSKVFEALRDLIPQFQTLFSDQYSVSFSNEAIKIWKRFGEAINGVLMVLENQIRHDTALAAVPGGIYPMTHDVMNVLSTLGRVFKEYPMVADREGTSSSYSVQIATIIELLESHLEAKSENCTKFMNPALGYVFMMNNGRYIQQIAKDSGLGTLLGDDWIRKRTEKVRQHLEHYQRSSWNKALSFLKLDSNEPAEPDVVAGSMKEKLNLFNMQFREIYRVQSTWFVLDEQLKEEIRKSIENTLLPAYGSFIGKFHNVLGKDAYKYIKYGMLDIQDGLNDLFRGTSG